MEDSESSSSEGLHRAAAILLRFIDPRRRRNIREVWRRGRPPEKCPAFVIADGFASQSVDLGWRSNKLPWVYKVGPTIKKALRKADIRGFSYFEAGYRYQRADTAQVPEDALGLFEDYAPQSFPVTYLAFSYGATLLTLGIREWLTEPQETLGAFINGLILVQPAFLLSVGAARAIEEAHRAQRTREAKEQGAEFRPLVAAHPGVVYLIRMRYPQNRARIEGQVVDSLRILREQYEIPIYLIYWPDDKFLEYPESALAQLVDANIELIPLDLSFRPEMNEFVKHCNVAQSDQVKDWIGPIALDLWQ